MRGPDHYNRAVDKSTLQRAVTAADDTVRRICGEPDTFAEVEGCAVTNFNKYSRLDRAVAHHDMLAVLARRRGILV